MHLGVLQRVDTDELLSSHCTQGRVFLEDVLRWGFWSMPWRSEMGGMSNPMNLRIWLRWTLRVSCGRGYLRMSCGRDELETVLKLRIPWNWKCLETENIFFCCPSTNNNIPPMPSRRSALKWPLLEIQTFSPNRDQSSSYRVTSILVGVEPHTKKDEENTNMIASN